MSGWRGPRRQPLKQVRRQCRKSTILSIWGSWPASRNRMRLLLGVITALRWRYARATSTVDTRSMDNVMSRYTASFGVRSTDARGRPVLKRQKPRFAVVDALRHARWQRLSGIESPNLASLARIAHEERLGRG